MTDEGAETADETVAGETVADETVADETVEAPGQTSPETDDPAAAAAEAKSAGRRWVIPVVAGVGAALIASTGALGWQVWQQHRIDQASREAQRAAVAYAQVLTSIDSDQVDENFKQVLDGATGEFKDMYSQSSVELRQLLIENKATARGVVIESAVQSASTDEAVVLLFVDQSVSNAKLPDPRIDRSRMKMTLDFVDGQWRASKVELP